MIQLRPTVAGDLPDLLGWVSSEAEMVLWSGPTFSWPLDLEQLDASLKCRESSRMIWTAFDHVAPTPVGHASLALQDNGHTGRLGRVFVAPNARHLGHGRAVTRAAVTAGFNETSIEVVTLGVCRHNNIARRLYEQLGFKTTTIVENSIAVDGEPWDTVEMRLQRHRA
jgi:RimJ/RimL family protein N-acetyltransferase